MPQHDKFKLNSVCPQVCQ